VAIIYVVKIISGFVSEKPAKHEKKIQPITILKPPPRRHRRQKLKATRAGSAGKN